MSIYKYISAGAIGVIIGGGVSLFIGVYLHSEGILMYSFGALASATLIEILK